MSNRKLSEVLKCFGFEVDAEGPADAGWVDVTGFSAFMAIVFRSVGSGGLDEFKILGNTAADGSGTDVELADYADVGTLSAVDAVGDWAMLEVTQADLDAAEDGSGNKIKGISVSVGHATASDESVAFYVLGNGRVKHPLLTPQNTIA